MHKLKIAILGLCIISMSALLTSTALAQPSSKSKRDVLEYLSKKYHVVELNDTNFRETILWLVFQANKTQDGGYQDLNWVQVSDFNDYAKMLRASPEFPNGTIYHMIVYIDNSPNGVLVSDFVFYADFGVMDLYYYQIFYGIVYS